MNILRFFGSNTREALHEIKRALGPDAVILSNRSVEGGVEVMAAAASEVPDALPETPPAPKRRATPARQATLTPEHKDPVQAGAVQAAEVIAREVIGEIKAMRGVLEEQLAGLAWGEMQRRDPVKAKLLRDLLHAGFSPVLSRHLIERMPPGCTDERGLRWLKTALACNLHVAEVDQMVAEGGVFALMGPTGVGKTTTTAKLAARCVVRHGADKLALLTTDGYRVGAQEQLRIYGKILGVPVHGVRDAADLGLALSDFRNKHMVLIDTVGMSQRDQQVAEQVAMLCDAGNVKRMLLLNATCSGHMLEDVVRAYRGNGLHGCLITKLDEAVGLGAALDVVVRHKLQLHYVTDGQRVPEDLHPANGESLLEQALHASSGGALYDLNDDELPLVMAAAGEIGALTMTEGMHFA